MFYKIIDDNKIIGVITEDDFRRLQLKHNIAIRCNIKQSQFVEYNYKYYRDVWLLPVDESLIKYKLVSIIEIDEEEYEALLQALEIKEQIEIDEKEKNPIEDNLPFVEENDTTTLDFVREQKLKEINAMCTKTINNGFDVVLSDGQKHHFSLTIEDQLNFITLSTMITNGEELVPYHEDGKICIFYSVEDVLKILNAATQFKTYQVTYCNSLKYYVKSLEDIESILKVTYGMEIPHDYQSSVLQRLFDINNEKY